MSVRVFISDTLTCDVLVIGGGAAGIRAALSAMPSGADVVLAKENGIGSSGSSFYPLSPPWGIMYARDEADVHVFCGEIRRASDGCADPTLVRLLAQESLRAYRTLIAEGIPLLSHAETGLVGCFGQQPRGALLTSQTAATCVWRGMLREALGLRTLCGWQAVSLLVQDDQACGAFLVDKAGQLLLVKARAVVLASGGGAGLYRHAFSYGQHLGAAYAMAARHGARCVNLEYIQFINGTLAPIYGLNYYHFTFREQPEVRNLLGEPFLEAYLPDGMSSQEVLVQRSAHGPYAVEDAGRHVDTAIVRESMRVGREGAIVRHRPGVLDSGRYRHWLTFLEQAGYASDTPMTLYPFSQAFNGGVRMHEDLCTDIPGLYVCGESAGGCHGANRMGGNAILATQVFGDLVGKLSAAYAQGEGKSPHIRNQEAQACLLREFEENNAVLSPKEIIHEIRNLMQAHAFLQRDAAGLSKAICGINALAFSPLPALGREEAALAFQARNALDAAKLVLAGMLAREESRGGHCRTDFPNRNPDYDRMISLGLDKAGRVLIE